MSESAPEPRDTGYLIFSEPTVEAEVIPSPQLFLDVIQRQWGNPGTGPHPTGTERRLYNVAPEMSELLQLPLVDGPVAALTSATPLAIDAMETLKLEDKRVKQALRKTHLALA